MTTEATPREVGSHAGLGPAPERAEVERLARWLEDAAFSDRATSFHEYEQAAKALLALQVALDAAIAAERGQSATLQAMLREVGKWDFRGRSVAEEYDVLHGAGSWRRAIRA